MILVRCGALFGLALVAAACRSPVACTPGAAATVLGRWNYVGTQTSPADASLSGVLEVAVQCERDFSGTLDVTEVNAQSQTRRLTGPVSGRFADSTSADFDAFFPADRRHVATIRADSIQGTWVELTEAGGGTASGVFTAKRAGP